MITKHIMEKPSLISDDIIKDTHDTEYVDLIKGLFLLKVFPH